MRLRLRVPALIFALTASVLGADEFPTPYNSDKGDPQPISPEEALSKLKLPPGFKATIFAAEPAVQNPIGMCFDPKGRLWVAENYTYAERPLKFDLRLRDRIVVFEDAKGDGHATKRTVYDDSLQMLTSIARGNGGVWAMCPPQLLFIPDKDASGMTGGTPQVVLDGFTVPSENYHNFANGLSWGPDGWLYGRCGASCPGDVGAPGTPAEQRVPVRGTMWRYHPQRKVFEMLCSGTTNPWGHDWDENGELFFINTVCGHLWHGITGAHFVRSHTLDQNQHVYSLIDQHADHYHFDTGKGWQASRDGAANDLGGGHAHCGTVIYQGDNWPAEYRNKLFTINFHGRRLNTEILERTGTGYVGKHGPDAMLFGDPWFRGIDLATGPDGGVFVLDWSDTGECHNATGVSRTSGRIYKITYEAGAKTPPSGWDISGLSPLELAKLHRSANDWYARQASQLLQEQAATPGRVTKAEDLTAARVSLAKELDKGKNVALRLRALWTLRLMGGEDDDKLRRLLRDENEHMRVWAIRLLTDDWPLDTCLGARPAQREAQPPADLLAEFADMAREDKSGLVRLTLASLLQRLPLAARATLAAPLLSRAEDATDHNQPMMVWYGLIALADHDLAALPALADQCALPQTRQYIARRIAEGVEKNPAPLNELLQITAAKPAAFQADVLTGMNEAFTGWRKAPKPATWDALVAKLDPALADKARDLGALFGDGRALDEVRRVALDKNADVNLRKVALQTLVDSRTPEVRQICEQLIGEHYVNVVALRGLAQESDPALGAKIVAAYKNFALGDRPQVITALVTRAPWAKALLDAIAANKVPRTDVTAFHARQIHNLNDAELNKRLTEVWGDLRESPEGIKQLIAQLRTRLTPDALAKADPRAGRAVFAGICATCHTLYGEGGKIGPDLTGANRDNLDYLLENIADPSAVVAPDFRLSIVMLKDGRVLSGMITTKTDRTLTLRTMTDVQTVERAEVDKITESPLSMMPEGLLAAFTPEQTLNLFSYLMGHQQVSLPEAK
ncbi:MAG: PVC-type heme-binding CxxCH protein [Chthoniobacter sp.]|uniref:PVC-type heme-binding CxxCH protein n=1 Tax=Chthoniobacter sp. TaxID=2510640 RepID=UPI0032A94E01